MRNLLLLCIRLSSFFGLISISVSMVRLIKIVDSFQIFSALVFDTISLRCASHEYVSDVFYRQNISRKENN